MLPSILHCAFLLLSSCPLFNSMFLILLGYCGLKVKLFFDPALEKPGGLNCILFCYVRYMNTASLVLGVV